MGGINAAHIINDRNMLRLKMGSRGNDDDYTLIRNKPEVYQNTHYNRSYSFATEWLIVVHNNFSLMTGIETERKGITSGRMGSHSDYTHSVYEELRARFKRFQVSVSARFDNSTSSGNTLLPGIGIVLPFGDRTRLRIRAEKSFRSPTYTEAYYYSPINQGNPKLKPERSFSFEAGVDKTLNNVSFGFTGFTRKSGNVIDWIRNESDDPWFTENHGELFTAGLDIKCMMSIYQNWNFHVNGAILNQSVSERKGTQSKYVLNPLKKSLVLVFSGPFLHGINSAVSARYEKMQNCETRFPAAIKFTRDFKKTKLICSVRNLFNEQYEEQPGLPAPERWLDFRVEYIL